MAKTNTLKNLPDALHARLAAAARQHCRSLNNEAIVCLEAGLGLEPLAVEQLCCCKAPERRCQRLCCSINPAGQRRRSGAASGAMCSAPTCDVTCCSSQKPWR